MAERDRSFGRAKLRSAAGVEPLEHLGLFQLRKQRMQAAPVIALVIDAIQNTLSAVIEGPNAPS